MRLRITSALALGLAGLMAFAPVAGAGETTEDDDGTGGSEETTESGDHGGGDLGDQEAVIHAAEELAEQNGASHFDAECIPILVEGGTVDECHEAPSPILPETNEVIWGGLSFFVLLILLYRFGYPAVKGMMADRAERIRSDLDAAETAKAQAQSAVADYDARMAEARNEAARIVEEARAAADNLKREQEARLQTELAEARTRAQADIDSAKSQALADLRGDVTQIALGAAEAVLGRALDRETQSQLVEDYISNVGVN